MHLLLLGLYNCWQSHYILEQICSVKKNNILKNLDFEKFIIIFFVLFINRSFCCPMFGEERTRCCCSGGQRQGWRTTTNTSGSWFICQSVTIQPLLNVPFYLCRFMQWFHLNFILNAIISILNFVIFWNFLLKL